MKEKVHAAFRKFRTFFEKQYGETKAGISYVFKILLSVFTAVIVNDNMGNVRGIPCLLIVFVVIFAILCLLKPIVGLLEKGLLCYGLWTLFLIASVCVVLYGAIELGMTPSNLSWQPSLAVLLTECIFARCFYALVKNKKRNVFVIVPFFFTLVVNGMIVALCIGSGYQGTYVEEYRELNDTLLSGTETVSYEAAYEVESFTYGMKEEEDIETKTVDLSYYFDSYTGITKWLRDKYWGYSNDEIPLEGKVWYPKTDGEYPILFIIHGNADMAKESYLGYEYLGEYLASTGYVVVSVNENWCNYFMGSGFSDENDARAVLLLENMKEVLSWNTSCSNPLYEKIQTDKVSIAGHSRGGEAAAIAAEFNNLSFYPDDGTIAFDYHFSIETVIAIAPTSDQYNPSGRTVSLKDVNYFLVQGGNDQDVSSMMGINQYNSVEFSKDSDNRKAYIYIAGANHGQFNTNWGRWDTGFPGNLILNTAPLLDGDEQRTVLCQYMKVCLDVTLKGDTTDEELLWDIDSYGKSLPETVYLQGYQEASYEAIAEYEEDADLTTASDEDSVITTDKLSGWNESKTSEYSDYETDNHAVYLEWSGTKEAEYEIAFDEKDFSEKIVSMDVMNVRTEDGASGAAVSLDFDIQLTDASGNTASVSVGDYKTIYPPLKIVFSKIVAKFDMVTYKKQFQTVRIDTGDFEETNVQLDLTRITKVSLIFNKRSQGKLLLDHVGIES